MRQLLLISLLIFLCTSDFAFGQRSKQGDALDAVNELLTEGISLDIKGKRLVLLIKDEKGKNRKDQVFTFELDPESISYDQENSMIVVNCYNGKCVQRQLFKQKVKRYYKRMSIPIVLEEEKVIQALSNLEILIK
ncbi:MAG: hypothetical protein HKN22_05790 [Bacteroidia bacterium]|nr:hypothetical protein [Bacteroidia bacterium]